MKKQPPIDEAWAKSRNEPPLNEGVGVLFLKKSTAHQRGVVEVSTATRRGRGRGVFKKINRPSTRRGQRVGTTRPSTRAWVCCFKKYKLEFRFPKNNRNTIIFCRCCCCLGTEIPIYHFLKQHTHALVEGWFVPTLRPRLVDGRLIFFKNTTPTPSSSRG